VHTRAVLIYLLKLGARLNPLIGPERSQCLSGTYRQPLAALRTSPLQHQAAVLGAHSDQETVRLPAPPRVRLERPLPLHIPSLGNEPSMLASVFGRCQSEWFVLQSRPFRS
jgi:hypothetical protein